MTKFVIEKSTKKNIFVPKRITREGITGILDIVTTTAGDLKVKFFTSSKFFDVSDEFIIANRDN
jgi:hypothetical protein